jgi:hypothetical protein
MHSSGFIPGIATRYHRYNNASLRRCVAVTTSGCWIAVAICISGACHDTYGARFQQQNQHERLIQYAYISLHWSLSIVWNMSDIVMCMCDYRRGWDWWMDLLTTYTHHSELQVITALLLTCAFYKSPQYMLSLFQHALSSPWQRLLTVEIFQLDVLRSSLHSLPYWNQLDSQLTKLVACNISARTT